MEPFAQPVDYEMEARKALQKGDAAAAQAWATLLVAYRTERMLESLEVRLDEIARLLDGKL